MSQGDGTTPEKAIIDCRMTFAEAVAGTEAPPEVLRSLCLIDVAYWAFDGRLHRGQLVVHGALKAEIGDIFAEMKGAGFPLARVVPIVRYGWSDEASMADNNSSAFNYRPVAGTQRLSRHAAGCALDINPVQNPVIYEDGRLLPPGAAYNPAAPGTLHPASPALHAFVARGWQWGGAFTALKDYHHFEKAM